jgi:hypothetical protein
MGRTKLTNPEKIALLVVIRKELKLLFEEIETTLPDYKEKSKSVIDTLSHILEVGLETDPEDDDIYKIFDN